MAKDAKFWVENLPGTTEAQLGSSSSSWAALHIICVNERFWQISFISLHLKAGGRVGRGAIRTATTLLVTKCNLFHPCCKGVDSQGICYKLHISTKADEWMGVKLDQVHSQASQNPTLAFAQLWHRILKRKMFFLQLSFLPTLECRMNVFVNKVLSLGWFWTSFA